METPSYIQAANAQECNFRLKDGQAGFSLIEILVALGLLSIVTMVITTMISNMARETKYLRESIASADVQKTLTTALSSGAVCNYALNTPTPLTFDSTQVTAGNKQVMSLPPSRPIYAYIDETGPTPVPGPVLLEIGKSGSAYADSLQVSAIELVVQSGSGANFIGYWQVKFDDTKLVRSIRPVTMSAFLTVDTTTPNLATITNCVGSGGGAESVVGFGGMFSWHRSYGTCSSANPKTSDCSCPSGYGQVLLISNGHDDGSKHDDQDLYYCVKL